ncbi:hypothetical protein VTJ49DRAFT_1440 [Mycothermus thermophilus]|uniref:Uncharacterized protein n=1 Tax=Humicola insolens TaxID=85995 RepID=A0ABR3VCJ6_HUMIN
MIKADDLVALSDAELDKYLKDNKVYDGSEIAFRLDVRAPDKLPQSFLEKLRERAQDIIAATYGSEPLTPTPVNYRSKVFAHLPWPTSLPVLPRDKEPRGPRYPRVKIYFGPRPRHQIRVPTPPELRERKCYEELLAKGGRSNLDLESIPQIIHEPGSFPQVRSVWMYNPEHNDKDVNIMERQLNHWTDFRAWQRWNRQKDAPLDIQEPTSKAHHIFRRWVQDFREDSSYLTAAMKILTAFGFTKLPVEIDEESSLRQDKLTEWIEYLVFECATFHYWKHILDAHQAKFDRSWDELVEANVLLPTGHKQDVVNLSDWAEEPGVANVQRKPLEESESKARFVLPRLARDHEPGTGDYQLEDK